MQSDQEYRMPLPVMHAEAEREREAGSPWIGITGDQGQAVNVGDLYTALGHYAETGDHDKKYPEMPYEARKAESAQRVLDGYGGEAAPVDLSKSIDLSSAEDRLKFLDTFTQQGADDKNSKNMCGPTSLIGGAILANGTDGVSTLLDAVDKMAPDGDQSYMQELRMKLDPKNPQPLTGADLQNAQKYIYERLNSTEGLDVNDPKAMEAASQSQRGVDVRTMQKLFQGDEKLSAMFKENHMTIAGIDTGGANGQAEDHAVLRVSDESGKKPLLVYDPYQRKNGQVTGRPAGWSADQSTTDNNGLADYEYALRGMTGPD